MAHKYSWNQYIKEGGNINIALALNNPAIAPLLITSYYIKGKLNDAKMKTNGDFWKIMDETFIHFYGYKTHFGDSKGGTMLMYYLTGIDENGNMSIGDALINGLSLIAGVGIGLRVTSTATRITSRIIRNSKFFRSEGLIKFLKNNFNKIKDGFFDAYHIATDYINSFGVIADNIGKRLIDDTSNLFAGLHSYFNNDIRNIFDLANPTNQQSAIDNIKGRINATKSIKNFRKLIHDVNKKASDVFKIVKAKVKKAIKNVKKFIKKIQGKINEIFKNIRSTIKSIVKKVKKLVDKVTTVVKKVKNKVKKVINKVKTTMKKIKAKTSKMVKNIKSTINNIKNNCNNFVKNMVTNLSNKLKSTTKKIKNTINNVKTKAANLVNKFKTNIKNVKIKTKNFIKHAKSKVRNFKNNIVKGYNYACDKGKAMCNYGAYKIKSGLKWLHGKGKAMCNYGAYKIKSGLNWAYNKGKQAWNFLVRR